MASIRILSLSCSSFVSSSKGTMSACRNRFLSVCGAGAKPMISSGTITIGGNNVTNLPEYKRAKFIGRVFQDPMMGTAATMQIEENLALAARRGNME